MILHSAAYRRATLVLQTRPSARDLAARHRQHHQETGALQVPGQCDESGFWPARLPRQVTLPLPPLLLQRMMKVSRCAAVFVRAQKGRPRCLHLQ